MRIPKLEWEDLISEHESEYSIKVSLTSRRTIKLRGKDIRILWWSSSESSGSDFYGEGDYSGSDVQSDQDSDHIQELRDASNFNEKEIRTC